MEDTPILDSRRSWMRLLVASIIAIVVNVGIWVIVLVIPAIQAEFGVDRATASLPFTLTMTGFAIGNMVIGRMVDRFGVSTCLILASIMIAASMLMTAFSPNMAVLTIVQFVVGLGTAVGFGPLIADVSQWFIKRRGIAVGIVASGNYLSGAIWPLLLSDLATAQSWRMAYIILAVVVVVVVIPMALLLRARLPMAAHQTANLAAKARASSSGFSPMTLMLLLGLAGIGCCIAMAMPQVHIVAYCIDLGYGPAVGAQMLSLMLLGGVISRICSGLLADYLGGVRTVLIGAALQCMSLFLFLPFDGLVPLYLISAVFGLSQGGIVPGYAVIVREYMPSEEAGRRVGFVLMTTVFGMAIGGWMTGWIYDLSGSYTLAFWNGIAWNLLNVAILTMLLIRTRPRMDGAVAA